MKAFPSIEPIYGNDIVGVKQSTGMDLRDYFAAKAMQGLLTHQWLYLYDRAKCEDCDDWGDYVVETSYGIADAMLAERNK
jgi:hypothetical protein